MASTQSLLVLGVVLKFDVTHLLFLQVLYERRALSENTLQLLNLQLQLQKKPWLQKLSSEIQITR